jgi:hypothetical protein
MQSEDPATEFALLLAKGITGFRQMMGTPEWLAQRKAGAILSPIQAPELLLLPGPIIVRQNASTPEIAVAEVRSQQAMGVDFIKMVDTTRDEYLAALDEAHRLGLSFAGHLPESISVTEAAAHGMTAIEHLGPTNSIDRDPFAQQLLEFCASVGSVVGCRISTHYNIFKSAVPALDACSSSAGVLACEFGRRPGAQNPAATRDHGPRCPPLSLAPNGETRATRDPWTLSLQPCTAT